MKHTTTLKHIYARCNSMRYEGENHDNTSSWCRIWRLSTRDGKPKIFLGGREDGRTYGVRGLVWDIAHPNDPMDASHHPAPKCGNPLCVSEHHLVKKKRNSTLKGKPKPLHVRQKIAMTKRAASPISDEVIEAIRASEEKNTVEAKKHGLNRHVVSTIKRHVRRADLTNPYLQLMEVANGR